MPRTFVISKTTTLKALTAQLSTDASANDDNAPAVNLATLQRLNPHISDLARIPAGTVVFVPDTPNARGATTSVGGQGFQEFAERARQAGVSTTERVSASYSALVDQQKEVATALKSAAIKKQVDADADLQNLVADSDAVFKADQQNAKTAQQMLETMQKGVADELAVLAKMFD